MLRILADRHRQDRLSTSTVVRTDLVRQDSGAPDHRKMDMTFFADRSIGGSSPARSLLDLVVALRAVREGGDRRVGAHRATGSSPRSPSLLEDWIPRSCSQGRFIGRFEGRRQRRPSASGPPQLAASLRLFQPGVVRSRGEVSCFRLAEMRPLEVDRTSFRRQSPFRPVFRVPVRYTLPPTQDHMVVGNDVARRPQAIAVRYADLPSVVEAIAPPVPRSISAAGTRKRRAARDPQRVGPRFPDQHTSRGPSE